MPFCPYCGKEMLDLGSFCPFCGKNLSGNDGNAKKRWLKPKIIAIIASAAVVLLSIILIVSHYNSADYLKEKLTENTWYQEPARTSYETRGSVCQFYLNNKGEVWGYVRYGGEWSGKGRDSLIWELMEDKTLYLNGEYYRWEEDWSLSGNRLVIEDRIYYLTNNFGYKH